MADVMDILLVILGVFSTVLGSVVTHYFRCQRDDKLMRERFEREDKLRTEEQIERRVCDAHEYFQQHYDALKPFLVAYTKLDSLEVATKIRPGESRLREYETRDAHQRLQETMESLSQATEKLVEEGYAALFPEKLYNSITEIQKDLRVFRDYVEEGVFPAVLDEYEQIVLTRVLDRLHNVRGQIRFLLNVDVLQD